MILFGLENNLKVKQKQVEELPLFESINLKLFVLVNG